MRKLFGTILAVVIFAIGASQFALATNRGVVYPGENPDALQANTNWRYQRLSDGTVLRDLLGGIFSNVLNNNGAWSNLNVVGNNIGLYVNVQPSSSPAGQAGAVYQLISDDPSPVPYTCPTGFPCSGYQLTADSTQIVIPQIVNATSANIGPLTCQACSSGQATSYLIEAQIQTAPGNNRSMMFVSTSGAVSFPNVNTEVDDTIAYASVQGGTASFSTTPPSPGASPNPTPPMPSPAPGWVPIAYVQSYVGGANCSTSCTITMDFASQFKAGTFGKITFGGQYAAANLASASTMTTSNNQACGLADSLGVLFDNPGAGAPGFTNNGNHELAVDQAGDVGVCGGKLYLFAQNEQNSEAPEIISNSIVAQPNGTPSPSALWPGANTGSVTTSGSCAANTICTLSAAVEICFSGRSNTLILPNAAMVTSGSLDPNVIFSTYNSGNNIYVNAYNATGGSITTGTTLNFEYVCM